jgi:hypothetical protein
MTVIWRWCWCFDDDWWWWWWWRWCYMMMMDDENESRKLQPVCALICYVYFTVCVIHLTHFSNKSTHVFKRTTHCLLMIFDCFAAWFWQDSFGPLMVKLWLGYSQCVSVWSCTWPRSQHIALPPDRKSVVPPHRRENLLLRRTCFSTGCQDHVCNLQVVGISFCTRVRAQ